MISQNAHKKLYYFSWQVWGGLPDYTVPAIANWSAKVWNTSTQNHFAWYICWTNQWTIWGDLMMMWFCTSTLSSWINCMASFYFSAINHSKEGRCPKARDIKYDNEPSMKVDTPGPQWPQDTIPTWYEFPPCHTHCFPDRSSWMTLDLAKLQQAVCKGVTTVMDRCITSSHTVWLCFSFYNQSFNQAGIWKLRHFYLGFLQQTQHFM